MKNYFYLIAGILFVILAITHTIFGLETALPILHGFDFESGIITVFTFQLHMIGVQDLIYGIALIIMFFQKNIEKTKFTAWVIIVIMLARWVIMSLVTIIYNDSLTDLLTSSVAFFILITLLLLGVRIKNDKKHE